MKPSKNTNIKKVVCGVCGKKRTYDNPFAKCFECKKKFCFTHIFGLQVNKKMKKNDEARSVCKGCKIKNKYESL